MTGGDFQRTSGVTNQPFNPSAPSVCVHDPYKSTRSASMMYTFRRAYGLPYIRPLSKQQRGYSISSILVKKIVITPTTGSNNHIMVLPQTLVSTQPVTVKILRTYILMVFLPFS